MSEVVDEHGAALKFNSKQVFRAALEIIFEREISHVLVGSSTIVVPPSRVYLFEHLKPTHVPIVSAAKLPPEEITKLRRENLSFNN